MHPGGLDRLSGIQEQGPGDRAFFFDDEGGSHSLVRDAIVEPLTIVENVERLVRM